MDPFYHPLDIELSTTDWRFLNFLSHEYLTQVKYPTFGEYEFPNYSHFFLRDAERDFRSQPIFKKISDLFIESPHSSVEHVYYWSQISTVPSTLPAHSDVRKAVISIPIVTFTSPIHWYDDQDNVVCEYDYEHAVTLINTEIRHGSPDNQTRRIFFQVGGFHEPYEKILSYLKKNRLT